MSKKRQNGKAKKFDEVKKHSRTSPDEQFKEFSLTKQTSRPETDYERTGKTILKKKSDQRNLKKNKINVKMSLSHVKKMHQPEMEIRFIQKTRPRMSFNGLGKPFRKNPIQKNRKNSKNQNEIAACEQKTTSEKANFCSNTVFSLYFKIRPKKIHAAKALALSLHFLFRRDQNHHSNLTTKIMKMCEQILKKKRQRPNTIQILWIVKNTSAIIAGCEDEGGY